MPDNMFSLFAYRFTVGMLRSSCYWPGNVSDLDADMVYIMGALPGEL